MKNMIAYVENTDTNNCVMLFKASVHPHSNGLLYFDESNRYCRPYQDMAQKGVLANHMEPCYDSYKVADVIRL